MSEQEKILTVVMMQRFGCLGYRHYLGGAVGVESPCGKGIGTRVTPQSSSDCGERQPADTWEMIRRTSQGAEE